MFMERIWKEIVMIQSEVVYWHLPERTEGNCEKLSLDNGSRFESGTSKI
jgi:hypothetical protein